MKFLKKGKVSNLWLLLCHRCQILSNLHHCLVPMQSHSHHHRKYCYQHQFSQTQCLYTYWQTLPLIQYHSSCDFPFSNLQSKINPLHYIMGSLRCVVSLPQFLSSNSNLRQNKILESTMKNIEPTKVLTSSHCHQTYHNQDHLMHPIFSVSEPHQILQMWTKLPFAPMIHHQCWHAFHSDGLDIAPRLLCRSYSKELRGSLTCNKTKNLSELKRMHLMPKVRSTREGIIIFIATWTKAVRASSVNEVFKFFPKNVNNFINTFAHHFFVGTWRIMQPWNHLIN